MNLQKLKELQNPKNQLTIEELIFLKGGIGNDDIESTIAIDHFEAS